MSKPIARRPILMTCAAALAIAVAMRLGVAVWTQDDLPPSDEPLEATKQPEPRADGFQRIHRQGAVVVKDEYDISNALIPLDEVHELLPRDAIPALTDPQLEPISAADWLPANERVIEIAINGEAVAAPFMILNYHEIANLTVGGEPVAATYCPLCDSASAISRRVTLKNGKPVTLEFGVSGALYNSNVLMYDNRDKALWSQVAMQAVSGPLAGTELTHFPVRIVIASEFALRHPNGKVLSIDTGYQRAYHGSGYAEYFAHDRTIVDVHNMGNALPKKTLGLGIRADEQTWFITAEAAAKEGRTIDTPKGPVQVRGGDRRVIVDHAPAGVQTIQTFYYAWSAFHPDTEVIAD